MTIFQSVLLFASSLGAGMLNSVAGGGSFLTFPSLLFAGVTPVAANATSTVALWPGTVASTVAYRRELAPERGKLILLSIISLAGGYLGAKLLLITPQATFRAMIPWLLLTATLVLAFGNRILLGLRARRAKRAQPGPGWLTLLAQFPIAIYGGFFGGGIGILMLAALSAAGMENIHAMNGVKNWLASCINGIAVITFVAAGAVVWPKALLMVTGAVLGGFFGATVAQKLPPKHVRAFAIATGFFMTGYFFIY